MSLRIHDSLRNKDLRRLASGIIMVQVGLTVTGFTGGTVLFVLPGSAYYWASLGLVTVLPKLDDQEDEEAAA